MGQKKIESATEFDWAMAKRAAERIVKICNDIGFVPPEALDIHQERIQEVCQCIDAIADGLRLRAGAASETPGGPAARMEPK